MSAGTRRILLVEDELDIRNLLVLHLRRSAYDVTAVADAESALALLAAGTFDLLLLDWMLPGMSGLDLCRQLVKAGRASGPRIVMMTARTSPQDVMLALDSGADDYITKPFDIPVVLARLRAILRRLPPADATPEAIPWGPITLRSEDFMALKEGAEIPLTPSEFKLLAALFKAQGRVLTRDRLISEVQGENVSVTSRTIDTHIFSLRRKLAESAAFLETIRGVGYRARPPEIPTEA